MLNYNMDIEEKSVWVCATPNELVKTFTFTCSEAGYFYAKKGFFTERDYKDCYWLVYTVSGEGILEQDNQTIILSKGSLVLLNCRTPQKYYTATQNNHWNHIWFHINGDGVKSLFSIINKNSLCAIIPQNDEINDICQIVLKNTKQKNINESLIVNFRIHEILNILAQSQVFCEKNEDSRHDEMLKVASYLRSNYNKDIQIDELACKYHLSKFYFIRIFKQYMGTTPYDYLLHYRITKAKELLCKTKWNTGRIGLYVGFGSENNFTAQFKRIVEVSPSRYRKENYFIEK